MCRFLETIRVEAGRALHLEYHQARVSATAAAHGVPALELADTVAELLQVDIFAGGGAAPASARTPGGAATLGDRGRQKLRIVYELRTGGPSVLQHELLPYHIRLIRTLVCVEAPGLRYDFKYADRSELDRLLRENPNAPGPPARETEPPAGETEPLLLRNGYLSDSRYANLVLREAGGRLLTPAQPLLAGTARARLLAAGVLHTAPLHISDLPHFQSVCLINAMLDIGDCELPVSAVQQPR